MWTHAGRELARTLLVPVPLASSSSHGLACIHPTWLEGRNDQQTIYTWPAFFIPLHLCFLHSWSSTNHLKSIPFPALLYYNLPPHCLFPEFSLSTWWRFPNYHELSTGATNWYTRTPALSQKHPEAFLALWRIYSLGVKHSSCPERTDRNITSFRKPCLYAFLNYSFFIVD